MVVRYHFVNALIAVKSVVDVIVAVISKQELFTPVIEVVLKTSYDLQLPLFYAANGILSAISDNVFVATVYMKELDKEALIKNSSPKFIFFITE